MHIYDFLHGGFVGKTDVVEQAAPQKSIRQFFFIVRGDDHDRAMDGFDGSLQFVHVKFHPIEFEQQVIREFDVGLVDLINQQHYCFIRSERFPQFAFFDVVADVVNAFFAQLGVAEAGHRIILIQALLGQGGRLDVPGEQFFTQSIGNFVGQEGFSRARFSFDQQGALQINGRIDRNLQFRRGNVSGCSLKRHRL